MRSTSTFIIFIFLIAKTFQLANSFVFAHLLGNDAGSKVMIGSIIFMGGIFILGLLIRKFLPPSVLNFSWIIVVFALIISFFIDPSWAIIFLAGIFLYALIGAEAQVLQSLNNFRSIPQFLPFLLTLFPVVISYIFPQTRIATPQLFYIVSSIFALLASYSARTYGGGKFIIYGDAPPLWLGLLFMFGSGFVYYLASNSEAVPVQALAFVTLFYVGGALIIYMALDSHVRQLNKT